jgi:SulP family sulfate permease
MPTLGAVLIYAGFRALRPAEIMTILRTGPNSQIAFATTFISTLFLPVAAAVGIGVALSLLLQLNQEAMDLAVVELCKNDDGEIYERRPPAVLTSHTVTVLDVYGSLFYAGSRTLPAHLPDPPGTEGAAVVLRLRGRTSLGSTFFKVIDGYAGRLDAAGGRLYLSGLDKALVTQLRRSGRVPVTGPVRLYEATPFRGESTRAAELDAETVAVGRHPEP